MLVFASRPLGCCSFQNILTNPIISQINTLLLPYFISYYSSAVTTATPRCTLRSILCSLCFLLFSNNYFDFTVLCWNACLVNVATETFVPCSLVGMSFSEHEQWILPRFPAEFFPYFFFFGEFFLASVLTVLFANCRSALF